MTGPDEAVTRELVSSASRAPHRGGVAAAAAFRERAVALTPDPAERAPRALAAAEARYAAGDFEAAQAPPRRARTRVRARDLTGATGGPAARSW